MLERLVEKIEATMSLIKRGITGFVEKAETGANFETEIESTCTVAEATGEAIRNIIHALNRETGGTNEQRRKMCEQTNNWRKYHGLPMRRKCRSRKKAKTP